jgi:hypothetical protein
MFRILEVSYLDWVKMYITCKKVTLSGRCYSLRSVFARCTVHYLIVINIHCYNDVFRKYYLSFKNVIFKIRFVLAEVALNIKVLTRIRYPT